MRNILKQAAEKNLRVDEKFEYLPDAAEEEKVWLRMWSRIRHALRHAGKKEYDAALQIAFLRPSACGQVF